MSVAIERCTKNDIDRECTVMKRILAFCAIAGLVVLIGCSADDRSPSPVPTPVGDTWAVTVAASPQTQTAGYAVLITANVTRNGSPAPNGTEVELLASGDFSCSEADDPPCTVCAGFGSSTYVNAATVVTTDGSASTSFFAEECIGATTYVIRARVYAATAQTQITFTPAAENDALQVYLPLVPDEGTRFGNEQVVLYGKGLYPPLEVYFAVEGEEYEAHTVSVADDFSSATILTPEITNITHDGEELATEYLANIRVVRGVGTNDEQNATYTEAFTFVKHDEYFPENLQIYLPLSPDEGDRYGGEEVVISGKAIIAPVEVFFMANTTEYQAETLEVVPSVPASATGTVRILTPPMYDIINGEDADMMTRAWPADVRIKVGVNTHGPNEQEVTEEAAFLFTPAQQDLPPEIYLVVPGAGDPRGGEMVTVLGRNFDANPDHPNPVRVEFIAPDRTLEGIDPAVSPDGHQIEVMTPQYSATPLEQNVVTDVRVTNLYAAAGTEDADTKEDAFVFLAENPTPEITSIAPTSGPIDGGTVVTIFGHGFDEPVQVRFWISASTFLEAMLIEVNDDTGLEDNDTIICVTPDASQQGLEPPSAVNVEVCNVLSGNCGELEGGFLYGDALFISGNSPSEGPPGTEVIIYGAGFEDPLQVELMGIDLEEQAVSGTEIVVRIPDSAAVTCEGEGGAFTVRLIERPQVEGVGFVTGGSFTLRADTPVVSDVDPAIVTVTMGGFGVTPSTATIHGQLFCEEPVVSFNDYMLPMGDILWVDANTIDILNVPAPADFSLPDAFFDTAFCTTDLGEPGERFIPTAVDVTVECGACSGTLAGGITYEPEDTTCHAAAPAVLVTLPADGGDLAFTFSLAGGGPVSQDVTISNGPSAGLFLNATLTLQGANAGMWSVTSAGTYPVAPGASTTATLEFNGTVVGIYTAQLVVAGTSTDPTGTANYGASTPATSTINLTGNINP